MVRVTLKREQWYCQSGTCVDCVIERGFGTAIKRTVCGVDNPSTNTPTLRLFDGTRRTYVLPLPLMTLVRKLDNCSSVKFYAKTLKEAKDGY